MIIMLVLMEHNEIKELIANYSGFADLEKYLQSEEGGQFRVVDRDESNGRCLIRYDKDTSNMTLSHSKWFRSVVWDTVHNRPLCIAPPKSCSSAFSCDSLTEATANGLVFEELLDGVMINAYKVVGDSSLHLATRSKLNATGHFYSAKPFRQLFVESVMETTLDNESMLEGRLQTISRSLPSPDPSKGERSTFFSFLIQHTENRIVTLIPSNRAFLVHSGVAYDDGRFDIQIQPYELAEALSLPAVPIINQSSVDSFLKGCEPEQLNKDLAGIVVKDAKGNRWTVRSDSYLRIKELRGNDASDLDRFVRLFATDTISPYLENYPEDTIYLQFHQELIRKLTSQLYNEYVDIHVKKTKTWVNSDKMFQPHLYALHGIYMKDRKRISMILITDYLRFLPSRRLSFLIRRMEDQYGSDDAT